MKNTIFVLALTCILSLMARGQEKQEEAKESMKEAAVTPMTISGYVVDVMCAKGMAGKETTMKKAKAHTKECALEDACAASGYGVFSEGKYYKFDEAGNTKAKELIENTKKEKEISVEVKGTLKGDLLAVSSIVEPKATKEEKKSEKKPESHEHQ